MEDLNVALGLSAIGLVAAFIAIYLVLLIGNIVIRLTNRFIPVADKSGNGGSTGRKAHPKKLAAIVAAVDVVTQGKGSVESIEKK